MMKKHFFISNRNSGKTHLAFYEFVKDPTHSLIILSLQKNINLLMNSNLVDEKFTRNIIYYEDFMDFKETSGFKKIIIDDYLSINSILRERIHEKIFQLETQEVFCFATAQKIYDKKMFNFIKEMKKNSNPIDFDSWACKNELLVEITDVKNKFKSNAKEELIDLYYNYITDPDTLIIHNGLFRNERIFNLNGVSYFPDVDRELTEIKGEYLRND